MFICMTQSLEEFIASKSWKYDAIVVEGYDGVGKGRVLDIISSILGVVPYRPDYNLWQKYDHRVIDRWKVSGFFWEIFSHFNEHPSKPFLFDRGVLSGAVYADNEDIAKDYRKLLGAMEVLHILVTCSEEDYYKFWDIRNSVEDTMESPYLKYQIYTDRYKKYLELSGVNYTIYNNHYDEKVAKESALKCSGCGHYSYGWCRHPDNNCRVDSNSPRCEKSREREVQDIHVDEMQCV